MTVMKDREKRQKIRRELYDRLERGASISEVIKDLRRVLSMDQQKFATHCEIGIKTLRAIEQKKNYQVESLQKILDKFTLELVVRKAQDD